MSCACERSHATCLRNGTRLQAGMRPPGVIAHFSGPLSVKRGESKEFVQHVVRLRAATCCLPAKQQSLARDCSCPTGLRVLFLVVEVQSTSSSRLARKPEKRTLLRNTFQVLDFHVFLRRDLRHSPITSLAGRIFACKRIPLRRHATCCGSQAHNMSHEFLARRQKIIDQHGYNHSEE